MGIRVQDDAHLFGAADMQRIMSANLPFDLHVLTSSSSTSRAGLEARVHDSIDAPNVVGIGIDPTHRWVVAHFGTGTGVPPSQWATIVASGNADLCDARWADGVLTIARTAASSRTEASISSAAYRDEYESSSAGVFIVGGFVLAVVALIGIVVWRARRHRDAMLRGAAFDIGGPAPVIVQSSSNDLLTGYVIGSAMHPSPVVEHHVVQGAASSPSYDAGSSFTGTSTFDAGGASTSFGGGGGFDGGGAGSSF